MKSTKEDDAIARTVVNASIEDAKADFKGSRQEAFAWGVYNALRITDPTELQKLRELLREHGIKVDASEMSKGHWIN